MPASASPQQVRKRKIGTVPFVAGQLSTLLMPRDTVYREQYLRLQATITASGTITSALTNAGVAPAGLWNIIKKLEILANGSDVLKSFNGEELNQLNTFWFSAPPRDQGFVPFASSGTTVATIDTTLILPYWMPKAGRPLDTAFDSRLTSSFNINVTWGSITDVISSNYAPLVNGTVSFTSGPTLTVYNNASFDPNNPQAFNQWRIFRQQDTSTFSGGAVTGGLVRLPVGQVYRGFMLHAKSAVSPSGANTGLQPDLGGAINTIRVKSGATTYIDIDARVHQEAYRQRSGINRLVDATGVAINFGGLMGSSTNYNPDAYYFVDLVDDGYLTEAIDTLGFAEFNLELDTNTAIPELDVLPMQVIPIRAAAQVTAAA